jgi:uncharacterized repeat protein (TIGR03803 family)
LRWSGIATRRVLLYLWLTAACVLALPRTGNAQALTTLYSFTGGLDGSNPQAGLIQGSDGNLYGTNNGMRMFDFGGSVFRITTSGTLTTLYDFTLYDGSFPSGLIQATDGNFYGTTQLCGDGASGTVFKVTPGGTFSILYTFDGGSVGGNPQAALIQGSDGYLYGTAAAGGGYGDGTVFRMTPSGAPTPLYSFTGSSDGSSPNGLIQATDGNFYGTTEFGGANSHGTVFRMTPGGTLTTLYSFANGSDGANPQNGLIQATDGNFYGTTEFGGANSQGTVFRITPGGTLSTLYAFTGGNDGSNPQAALIQATDGYLYGTTPNGGTSGAGTIFRITTSGTFTPLYSFSGSGDGDSPNGLIQAADGNFYGTTQGGRSGSWGTVFRLNVPILTSLSPDSATAGGPAFTLTVNGAHFVSGATVTWNSTALTTVFVSSTQLTASVPAADIASAGTASVSVTNAGTAASNALTFTIKTPGPLLSTLSPSSTMVGGAAFTLVVIGAHFLHGVTLYWNGTALPTTYLSPLKLKATVPAADIAVAGQARITATNPGSSASNALTFAVNSPAPSIVGTSPPYSIVGGAAYTLTVNGSNFVNGATVKWNNAALATTFVSSTQVTASVPASDIASVGSASITAVNPYSKASNTFTYYILSPAPSLTSMSPASATVGGPTFTLTLNGSGFKKGATVYWNSSNALTTTFVSKTQLTAQVPAYQIATGGTALVTVANPKGEQSNPLTFTINNLAPSITSLSPNSANAGGPAFTLTVTGSGFVSGATIYWNGTARRFTNVVSSTQVTCNISSADIAAAGTASVTVTNPGTAPSNALTFTINNALPPSLTSLSPSSATAGGPAFTLTISGSGFLTGATVFWNGTALSTTYGSPSTITAQVPAADIASAGTAGITVTNPGSAASNALTFSITNPMPSLRYLTPNTADRGSDSVTITLNGNHFVAGSVVQWTFNGTTTVLASNYISSTQLSATVTSDLLTQGGTATVQVVNPAPGGGSSNGQQFTIL